MLSVAPEGTLSHGRCVLTFKTGAFVPGMPVVPIILRYKLTPHNPAWTIIIPFWHVLRLMCQFENAITVQFFPPYIPSAAEKADPALYAANIRKFIVSVAARVIDVCVVCGVQLREGRHAGTAASGTQRVVAADAE